MTVKDMADYWRDREFLPDEDREVVFKLGDVLLEVKGTTVPEKGPVSVEMAPVPARKYMFSLKFGANPVIEAHTVEEAEAKAYDMMRSVSIMRQVTTTSLVEEWPKFEAQEPRFLKEVEE